MAQDFNKIRLGRLKADLPYDQVFAAGEVIWLEKHKWECDWYWGFGYLGNRNCHFHFESLLYPKVGGSVLYSASQLFSDTKITDKEWWVVRDLFVQAYALKKAAEVYQYGGHQTSQAGVTDIIKSSEQAARINADLKIVLDKLWDVVCDAVNKQEAE